jgi:hypothetical protein
MRPCTSQGQRQHSLEANPFRQSSRLGIIFLHVLCTISRLLLFLDTRPPNAPIAYLKPLSPAMMFPLIVLSVMYAGSKASGNSDIDQRLTNISNLICDTAGS